MGPVVRPGRTRDLRYLDLGRLDDGGCAGTCCCSPMAEGTEINYADWPGNNTEETRTTACLSPSSVRSITSRRWRHHVPPISDCFTQ